MNGGDKTGEEDLYPATISFDADGAHDAEESEIPSERMDDTGKNCIKDFGTVSVAMPTKSSKAK